MPIGANTDNRAVNNLQPNNPPPGNQLMAPERSIPVISTSNFTPLPTPMASGSQGVVRPLLIDPRYEMMSIGMPREHLLATQQRLNSLTSSPGRILPEPAPRPSLSTLAQPPLPGIVMLPPNDFYKRITHLINYKRVQREQSVQSVQGKIPLKTPSSGFSATLLAKNLTELSLNENKADKPEGVLSSDAVAAASASENLKRASANQAHQQPAFSTFYDTKLKIEAKNINEFLDGKARLFYQLFPEKFLEGECQTFHRLCLKWNTLDFESVIAVCQALEGAHTIQQIERMSLDDIVFYCSVERAHLDTDKPVLSNFNNIKEIDPSTGDIEIFNWHKKHYPGAKITRALPSPKTQALSTFKNGGIIFRAMNRDRKYFTLHNNPDTIEVRCTLKDLLLSHAKIDNQTETFDRVFIRLPPDTVVKCTVLEKNSDNSNHWREKNT